MANTWRRIRKVCPFYISETKQTIRCESPFCFCACVTMSFASEQEKMEHIKTACNTERGCAAAVMLRKKLRESEWWR